MGAPDVSVGSGAAVAGRLVAQPIYPHSRLDRTARSCREFAHRDILRRRTNLIAIGAKRKRHSTLGDSVRRGAAVRQERQLQTPVQLTLAQDEVSVLMNSRRQKVYPRDARPVFPIAGRGRLCKRHPCRLASGVGGVAHIFGSVSLLF
jgi:hypothetical protein